VSRAETRAKEEALLDALWQHLLEGPLTDVTVRKLAESCGRSFWSVYHSVYRVTATREHLIRRAVLRHASRLVPAKGAAPEPAATISTTIHAWVAHLAEIVAAEEYRQLLYLLLRDRAVHPWIEEIYERQVAGPLCRGLEKAARAAGDRAGVAIFFRENAIRRCLRTLEAAISLPQMLPRADELEPGSRAALVRTVAAEAMAASYAYELGQVA
jgi:hypothetical protein